MRKLIRTLLCSTLILTGCILLNTHTTQAEQHHYTWHIIKAPSDERAQNAEDFGERILSCDECGDVKITESMINLGKKTVCGVFNDAITNELVDWVDWNVRYNTRVGFAMGGGYDHVPPLSRCTYMDFLAKIRTAEAACEYEEETSTTNSEVLSYGYTSAQNTYYTWSFYNHSDLGSYHYTQSGCASFWYDADDSGENLDPVHCMTLQSGVYYDRSITTGNTLIRDNFEDELFLGAINNQLYHCYLSTGDCCASITMLDISLAQDSYKYDIKSIRGIKNLTSLTSLNLSDRDLSSMKGLDELASLPIDSLYLDNCNLSNLDFLKGMNLKYLSIANNHITDLSALEGMQLEYLNISGNNVSDINILKGMPLHYVNLNDNNISDISSLDSSRLNNLLADNNAIKDVSVLSGIKGNFFFLHLDNNQISDISSLHAVNYYSLKLSNNKIRDISSLAGAGMLYCKLDQNQITDISALHEETDQRKMITLDLSNNQIADISPLAGSTNITELNLSNNKIADISELSSIGNEKHIFDVLNLSHNQIKDIGVLSEDSNFSIHDLDLSYNLIENVAPLKDINVNYFRLDHNRITSISSLKGGDFLDHIEQLISAQESLFNGGPASFHNIFFCYDRESDELIDLCMLGVGNSISRDEALAVLPDVLTSLRACIYDDYSSIWIKSDTSWMDSQAFTDAPYVPSTKLGDVNQDNEVSLSDANITLKAALGIISIDAELKSAADVDKDGDVTLSDANMVLKMALGIL